MKHLCNFFCLISCFGAIAFQSCSHKPNELETAGLKGKVKSIREISYQAFGNTDTIIKGEIVMNQDLKNYFATYNIDGNMTSIVNYDNLGNQIDKWIFRYNNKGLTLGGNFYANDNTLLDSTTYIYDSEGNVIEYYHYDSDGRLKSKTINTYDEKGNVIESKIYDSNNLLFRINKYKYKKRNLIEDVSLDRNSFVMYFSQYTYDNNSNLVNQIINNADSSLNTEGVYCYNEHSDIVKSTIKVPNEPTVTYTYSYKYDDRQNWIQKIMYLDTLALFLTIREFEYFK